MKVETGSVELADGLKAIQADVDEEQFIQGPEPGGPGSVEPAQVDGQAEQQQNDGIPPVAVLFWVDGRCLLQEGCDGDRKCGVQGKPVPSKYVLRNGNQDVGHGVQRGNSDAGSDWPALDGSGDPLGGTAEGGCGSEF